MRLIASSNGDPIKIMSERELCRTFKVSRPTARKALKDLIKEGRLVVRPGIGTFVNPAVLDSSKSSSDIKQKNWGLLIGDGRTIHWDQAYCHLLSEFLKTMMSLPVRLCHINLAHEDECVIEEIKAMNLDGLACFFPTASFIKHLHMLENKLDIVQVNYAFSNQNAEFIIDHTDYGMLGGNYLLEKGHRNIVFVEDRPDSSDAQLTLDGFKKAFINHGVEFDPSLLLWENDYKIKLKTLIELKKGFSAVFTSPVYYHEIVKILQQHRLPDIDIITEYSPTQLFEGNRTTFIHRPMGEAGKRAGEAVKHILSSDSSTSSCKKLEWKIEKSEIQEDD